MNTPTPLLNAVTANGSSTKVASSGDYMSILAQGVFGGATITVEASGDNGVTWVSTGVTLTAAGIANFILGEGICVRFTLSGASGTTNVTAFFATC